MNPTEVNPEFEALLDYLKHSRGCNLTSYKRSTLMRRFQHRMRTIKIDSYQTYLQYLQCHSDEYLTLLNDVLINVTSFFRDRDAWDYLAAEIIPRIIASKPPDEPIRVWSAGCAAGQEMYSLLILWAEALGIDACLERVKCYATDVDEDALQQARQGIYSTPDMTGLPANWLEKYFQLTEQGYVFHPQLRSTVVFGQHDLSKAAPISKIDLLVCRNLLIYFTLEAQTSIFVRFHFALKNTGFLFLGKSETLVNCRPIFTPINSKHRIYAKGLHLALQDYLFINPKPRKTQAMTSALLQSHFWQTAFEASPIPQLAVDLNGRLVHVNEQANLCFELTLDDWNRPFPETALGKLLSSHASMQTWSRSRHPLLLKQIEWNSSTGSQSFDVAIAPVFNPEKQLLGMTLAFLDTTTCQRLAAKLESSDGEVERLAARLQAAEAKLRTTQMELEAAQQEISLLAQDPCDRN